MTSPLPIHPWPMSEARFDILRAAKAELALSFQVIPVEAVPGSPGRVLAFGEMPTHVCDVVMVNPEFVDDPRAVKEALRQVLTVPEGVITTAGVGDYMKSIFGPETREITDPVELQIIADQDEQRRIPRRLPAIEILDEEKLRAEAAA